MLLVSVLVFLASCLSRLTIGLVDDLYSVENRVENYVLTTIDEIDNSLISIAIDDIGIMDNIRITFVIRIIVFNAIRPTLDNAANEPFFRLRRVSLQGNGRVIGCSTVRVIDLRVPPISNLFYLFCFVGFVDTNVIVGC